MAQAVTEANFDEMVLSSDLPVLVDFWAQWCGPCLAIGPSIDEIATEMEGQANVFKLDVDANNDIMVRYGVMSIPALLVFKGGQEVDRHVGAAPKAKLKDLIQRHF